MHEFMLNIDNKEILNEVLHHSVDHLIGSFKDSLALAKSSHKYGFENPEEFEQTTQMIANAYKLYILNSVTESEFLSPFSHMNQDLQQSILDVVKARKPEIVVYLLREQNSKEFKLLQSFDWDFRLIFGDSNNPSLKRETATVTFNCLDSSDDKNPKESSMFFELNRKKLEEFIKVLENCKRQMHDTSLNKPQYFYNGD